MQNPWRRRIDIDLLFALDPGCCPSSSCSSFVLLFSDHEWIFLIPNGDQAMLQLLLFSQIPDVSLFRVHKRKVVQTPSTVQMQFGSWVIRTRSWNWTLGWGCRRVHFVTLLGFNCVFCMDREGFLLPSRPTELKTKRKQWRLYFFCIKRKKRGKERVRESSFSFFSFSLFFDLQKHTVILSKRERKRDTTQKKIVICSQTDQTLNVIVTLTLTFECRMGLFYYFFSLMSL